MSTTSTSCAPPREGLTRSPAPRVLVVPDVAAADRHEAAVTAVMRFAVDWQPDQIVLLSGQTLCRRCGTSSHKRGAVGPVPWVPCGGYDHAKLTLTIRELRRRGYAGPVRLIGQTAQRPAESCDTGRRRGRLSELADLAVIYGPNLAEIAPGWSSVYARTVTEPRYAGYVAISMARIMKRSIICAGTRSLATITESFGTVPASREHWGIEVGTLKATTPAPRRSDDASLGFGVIESEGAARPILVTPNGGFSFDGVRYG